MFWHRLEHANREMQYVLFWQRNACHVQGEEDQFTLFDGAPRTLLAFKCAEDMDGSTAAAPPVTCEPAPPRRFLFSLPTLRGGAKLPTGGILISGFGV